MFPSPHIPHSALMGAVAALIVPVDMAHSYHYEPAQTVLTGTLRYSETGHHQTNVLITDEQNGPAK